MSQGGADMPELSLPLSFRELIHECQRIEIPLIQRDYAQGRESQKDVRNDFLDVLHRSLSLHDGDLKQPLNLDFIYGSFEAGNAPRFLPLDGQQRLTTLFLLHWYLAWRDDRLSDFKAMLWDGRHSRFTYGVRPSSVEFFDALAEFFPTGSPDDVPSLRQMLEDQAWYFLNWRLDPTIQAVLTMLDAIHTRFQKSEGFYARLTNDKPAITFYLLPLEHFGLSDDLYIKMNARGKPLTAFETFKARFEDLLKDLFPTDTRKIQDTEWPVPVFFEHRMDTRWTNFFWTHQGAAFDDAVLNLMWALIRVSLDPASPSFARDTSALGESSLVAGFTLFHDRGWLTRRFAEHLMDLLEAWSAGGSNLTAQLPDAGCFDESAFFERATTAPSRLTYLELVQFAAFVFYITRYRGAVNDRGLRDWIRVVTNLAANSDIERPEDFGRSLASLQELVSYGDRILQRLTESDFEISGFSPQQVREEAVKATLILSSSGWRERIESAESHGYFKGQIEFLLKFSGVLDRYLEQKSASWSNSEHAEYQRQFSEYLTKASTVFSENGLNDFGAYRWERALLTKGDYLLERGLNRSLLDNSERDASWKRLLRGSFKSDQSVERKRQHVRELFDEIDVGKGVKQSLDDVLARPVSAEPWRQAIVEQAETIDYCWGRKIRWHPNGNIYLMRKIQMNGEHAELFTFHLKAGLLLRKHKRGELSPFMEPRYQSVNGGDMYEPHVFLEWLVGDDKLLLRIEHREGVYVLKLTRPGGTVAAQISSEYFSQAGFNYYEEGEICRRVEMGDLEAALDEVVAVTRHLMARTESLVLSTGATNSGRRPVLRSVPT